MWSTTARSGRPLPSRCSTIIRVGMTLSFNSKSFINTNSSFSCNSNCKTNLDLCLKIAYNGSIKTYYYCNIISNNCLCRHHIQLSTTSETTFRWVRQSSRSWIIFTSSSCSNNSCFNSKCCISNFAVSLNLRSYRSLTEVRFRKTWVRCRSRSRRWTSPSTCRPRLTPPRRFHPTSWQRLDLNRQDIYWRHT